MKKKKKTPTYNVTYDEIKGYVQRGFTEGRQKALIVATTYSLAVPMMILRDQYGFGRKRLLRFYHDYLDLADSLDRKYLNINDIIKTLNEEVGINILEELEEWKKS